MDRLVFGGSITLDKGAFQQLVGFMLEERKEVEEEEEDGMQAAEPECGASTTGWFAPRPPPPAALYDGMTTRCSPLSSHVNSHVFDKPFGCRPVPRAPRLRRSLKDGRRAVKEPSPVGSYFERFDLINVWTLSEPKGINPAERGSAERGLISTNTLDTPWGCMRMFPPDGSPSLGSSIRDSTEC